MRRVALRVGTAIVFGLGLVGLSVAAEPPKDDPTKAPTFPGYVFVADAVGEVVKADDSSVTLRITWLEPQAKKGNNGRRNLSGPLVGLPCARPVVVVVGEAQPVALAPQVVTGR